MMLSSMKKANATTTKIKGGETEENKYDQKADSDKNEEIESRYSDNDDDQNQNQLPHESRQADSVPAYIQSFGETGTTSNLNIVNETAD